MNDEHTTPRIVHFSEVSVDRRTKFIEKVGYDEFFRAIGYLSTWNPSYPEVHLILDTWSGTDAPEIVATYHDVAGLRHYTIVAVFNPDTKRFGFHS